jgi:hypothetical protein
LQGDAAVKFFMPLPKAQTHSPPQWAHGALAAMPTHEKPSSEQIGFFGLKALAQVANALAKLGTQPNGAQKVRNEYARFNMPAHKAAN